jgi:biotin synthase-related radical SAM superfamily protein
MRLPFVSRARYERLARNVERLERSRRDLRERNRLLKAEGYNEWEQEVLRLRKGLAALGRENARLTGVIVALGGSTDGTFRIVEEEA